MNCLAFRRHCLAEPGSQDRAYLRHKRECPRCADYSAGTGQLDRKLAAALHVGVPDNLASRIILRQSIERDATRKRRRVRWYALAAGVLVTIGLGAGLVVKSWTPSLNQALITHLTTEGEMLLVRQDATSAQLARVLHTVGAELKGDLGELRHVSLCHFSSPPGAHLVFDGHKGPVIVLLLPKAHVGGAATIRSERFEGVIVPTNNGSMAIVGEHGENVYEIEHKLRSNLTWRL